MEELFPVIDLHGTPVEIGTQHGTLLKERIHESIRCYMGFFKRPEKEILEEAGKYRNIIDGFNHDYIVEMDAIASAAAVDPHWIYALNARTEIMTTFVNECTAAFFPQPMLLGQNWDWSDELERLAVVMRIKRADGHVLLQMTEPGIIGKIGLNSKGVGTCLNFLTLKQPLQGVPVHVLLRAILDQDSAVQANTLLLQHHKGLASNIMVADATGDFYDVELAGPRHYSFNAGVDIFFHTNHYLGDNTLNVDVDLLQSSFARYSRGQQLSLEDQSIETFKQILADQGNAELPICRKYIPDVDIGTLGTVCSIIMDLRQRSMYITHGNPFEHEYRKHDVLG